MLGAAISNTIQNGLNVEFSNDEIILSHDQKRLLSIWVMNILARSFNEGRGAVNTGQLCKETGMSVFVVSFIIKRLELAGLVSRVVNDDKTDRYFQPLVPPKMMTIDYIEHRLDQIYEQKIMINTTEELLHIKELLAKRRGELEALGTNINVSLL